MARDRIIQRIKARVPVGDMREPVRCYVKALTPKAGGKTEVEFETLKIVPMMVRDRTTEVDLQQDVNADQGGTTHVFYGRAAYDVSASVMLGWNGYLYRVESARCLDDGSNLIAFDCVLTGDEDVQGAHA